MDRGQILTGILGHLRALKAWASAWRFPILMLALAGFVVGCVISVRNLDIDPASLQIGPLLVILIIIIPVSIAYSAVNMMLMGHAAKVSMSFWQAVKVSVFSQVAEVLPIPGGAIVRGAALIRAGSSAVNSAELVLGFSLLWIAVAAGGAGLALIETGWPGYLLLAGGAGGALLIAGWLAYRFRAPIAIAALLLRFAGLVLVAVRLMLAFAIIGIAMSAVDAAAFAFATIMGSAASIVPAGLGISEALASLLAQPAGVAPAAAFLATALSRLLGLAVNLLLALGYTLADRAPSAEPSHG